MSTHSSDIDRIKVAVSRSLHAHWQLFLVEGIVLLALGLAAIVLPLIATVAVAVIIGWLLLMSGIVGLIATFRMRQAPGFIWSLLSAVLGIAVGVLLLWWPLTGALSLTVMLTVFFVIEGVASIFYALEHKRELSARWVPSYFLGSPARRRGPSACWSASTWYSAARRSSRWRCLHAPATGLQ